MEFARERGCLLDARQAGTMKLWSVCRVDARMVDFSCERGGLLGAHQAGTVKFVEWTL